MRIGQRVFAISIAIIAVLVALLVMLADRQLHARLVNQTVDDLTHEAQLLATEWRPGVDPDSLADATGRLLRRRVTLIDPDGHVLGDTEFDPPALYHLQNHAARPEVREARRTGIGTSRRESPSEGKEELYVAVRAPLGTARLSVDTRVLEDIIGRAERDVLTAAGVALLVALLLATLFARSVSRPIVELRDVARALAAGDLERRPRLAAPGEIGDLAEALSRMAEQLAVRLTALQAHDDLMIALIESLSEGVLAVNAQGNVVRVNASGAALLGLRDRAPFSSAVLPRDRTLREALAEALRGTPQAPVETTINGRAVAITARPLADHGAVVTLFDLTPLRRLEVVRRDFVANVSHELRTPLTAIQGFAETLADPDVPEDARRRFVATIHANAARMQRLVDDLLDLSRIESGGWQPEPVEADVDAIITEAIANARVTAAEKRLALHVDIGAGAERVHADPTALRQIVANLAENAVRYTHEGRVTISARRSADGVILAVADTGIGIPPEHLPRVFERFYRVDASRSRELGGTGLGLAIVRHLAEAHGGWARAESGPGRGTMISVFFPDG